MAEKLAFPWRPVCDGTYVLDTTVGCVLAVEGFGLVHLPRTADAICADVDHKIQARAEAAKAAKKKKSPG